MKKNTRSMKKVICSDCGKIMPAGQLTRHAGSKICEKTRDLAQIARDRAALEAAGYKQAASIRVACPEHLWIRALTIGYGSGPMLENWERRTQIWIPEWAHKIAYGPGTRAEKIARIEKDPDYRRILPEYHRILPAWEAAIDSLSTLLDSEWERSIVMYYRGEDKPLLASIYLPIEAIAPPGAMPPSKFNPWPTSDGVTRHDYTLLPGPPDANTAAIKPLMLADLLETMSGGISISAKVSRKDFQKALRKARKA